MQTEDGETASELEIRQLVLARAEAMQRRDADALAQGFSPSAVVFEMVPPLRLPPGAASDASAIHAWLGGWEEPHVEVRDVNIHASGGVAFACSLNRLSGTQVGGRKVDMWMRSTLGFEKTEAGWVIVHAHTSVPFYPNESLKAAVDLKPQ